MIVAVEIIAVHLKLIHLVSRSHPLPFSFNSNLPTLFSVLVSEMCLTYFHFLYDRSHYYAVPCTIIKLNYKMSRSPWVIEVYTKLLVAATTLVRFSYQQSKWFSLTAKLFWSLKSNSQKLNTYVVWARLHKTFLRQESSYLFFWNNNLLFWNNSYEFP